MKFACVFLAFLLALSSINFMLTAEDMEDEIYPSFSERVDMEADFSEDIVMVVLKKENSKINGKITEEDFPEIVDNIDYIEDLTYYENPQCMLLAVRQ